METQKFIRRLLKQLDTNPDGLAEIVGVHRATVYRWLAGEKEPEKPTQHLLRRLLDEAKAREGAALVRELLAAGGALEAPGVDSRVARAIRASKRGAE